MSSHGRELVATGLPVVAVVALALVMLFWRLGEPALFQPDEGRNSEIAREMSAPRTWLVPTLDGFPYLDKPALFFGMVAVSLRAVSDPEAAARLPSALLAAALLGLVGAFYGSAHRARGGGLAVSVLSTTLLFVVFARIVIFDMSLAFFTCAAILAGYHAEECEEPARARWYAAGAAAVGVATLIKGPVGFVVPGLVLGAFHLAEGRRDALRRLFAPRNALIFFALVLPWFLGVTWLRPDFPRYGIVHESLKRFTTNEFNREQPFYFFPVVLALGCLPWSLIWAESGLAAWRARTRLGRADRLYVIWTLVVLVFFSLSKSKLAGYVLSATVPLALATARVFGAALSDRDGRCARVVARASVVLAGLAALLLAGLLACVLAPKLGAEAAEHASLAPDQLRPLCLGFSLALAAIVALAVFARWRRAPRAALLAFTAFPVVALAFSFPAYVATAEHRSARTLAHAIPALPEGAEVACMQCFPTALPFYLGRTITVVTESGRELTSNYLKFQLAGGAPWPEGLVRRSELEPWLDRETRTRPVYIITKARKAEALAAVAAPRGARVEPLTDDFVGALIPPSKGP